VKNQAKATLLESLVIIAARATTEPLDHFKRGMSWEGPGTTFTLPEPAAFEFLDFISKLVRMRPWGERFSEEYLQQRLVPILKSAHADGPEAATPLLDELIEEVETYSIERTVYVPVQGLSLSIDALEIGRVVLRTIEGEPLDGLRRLVESIHTEPDGGEQNHGLLAYRQRQITEKLGGKVCAEFRTVAEPIRARQLAEEETRRALELLTFANAALFPFQEQADAVVGLEGERPTLMPWIAITSADSLQDFTRRAPMSWTLPITAAGLERFEQVGVFVLSDLLVQPTGQLTDLEEALLRAVHWFATSQAQAELENRLLNLTTCLEALLAPTDGSNIASGVAKGAALIVAQGSVNREQVRAFVRTLYRARSAISHGGKKAVAEADVFRLRWIVTRLITTLLQWSADVRTRQELLNWLEAAKQSGDLTSPPIASGRPKTVRQLREERSWTQEDLAIRTGMGQLQVDYWEKPGMRPDLDALRRFADAFGLHPEDIAVRPVDRWVNVGEHRFLLSAHRQEPGKWIARVEGWDYKDAKEWPCRAVDPAYPDIDSPSILLSGHWRDTGVTAGKALTALADRMVTSMERALSPQRIPDDPPDWRPPEIPEHWRQHLEARQHVQRRSDSGKSVDEE
jgi:transcriptional regulator with XRE-family HTH domain